MKEHMKNGLAVAKFLETHPKVEKVLHPCMYWLYLALSRDTSCQNVNEISHYYCIINEPLIRHVLVSQISRRTRNTNSHLSNQPVTAEWLLST